MGIACARRFAQSGDTVFLVDLDSERAETVAAELRSDGGDVTPVGVDVVDQSAVASLAEEVAARGQLRAIAHTAGLSPTMASWDRILSVNLIGTVHLLDAFEPLVGDGSAAVCVASQAGHLLGDPDPTLGALLSEPLTDDFLLRSEAAGITDSGAAYGWSKWAVRRLVIERAPAWGARGGRIVSLSPGIIDTPMGQQELENQPFMPTMIEMTPLERMGTADEIASVVEFLCSPGASFVTGTDILVDGGSTEQLRAQLAQH